MRNGTFYFIISFKKKKRVDLSAEKKVVESFKKIGVNMLKISHLVVFDIFYFY